MKRVMLAAALAAAFVWLGPFIQAQTSPEPYKLGTFEREGRTFVGLVLRDTLVVDVAQANDAMEGRIAIPGTVNEVIEEYETVRSRLQAIAQAASAAGSQPYVHQLQAVTIRPPVRPQTILNAAVNYVEHGEEMQGRLGDPPPGTMPPVPDPIPGIWQRQPDDTRHNPYLFLKPVSAVIADGEAIRLPPGRDRIDWECELSVVVGRTARHVPVDRAADYIFGFTLQNDVSDRGGRGDGRHGSDWLIGKGHDTFAPLGPFVVPKEFVPDPQKLAIKFTLNGEVMQDSNTERMTHTVYEMTSYASNILTLVPGDIIATGSPAGVGTARETPIYMKAGDRSVCSIESIGTLTNPVEGPTS